MKRSSASERPATQRQRVAKIGVPVIDTVVVFQLQAGRVDLLAKFFFELGRKVFKGRLIVGRLHAFQKIPGEQEKKDKAADKEGADDHPEVENGDPLV